LALHSLTNYFLNIPAEVFYPPSQVLWLRHQSDEEP
jgi:hypothetical protein